ncbi:pyridine nucleotide-disulfide oxidoreductase [Escherichia coli]|uniref:Pyridine nucleotide-disulfide oxidoreductase n=1 Tax=Escherichia coli TaxID=562 RepID=A0A376NUN2_ECOLX|nr:pyridine nucleotide-disulfide oxidoreductase [Escherichia coli]
MGDIMRPIPFEELLTRIFDEYQQQRSIFGIPEQQFYSPVKGKTVSVFGEPVPLPSALPLARTRSSRKILSLPG